MEFDPCKWLSNIVADLRFLTVTTRTILGCSRPAKFVTDLHTLAYLFRLTKTTVTLV